MRAAAVWMVIALVCMAAGVTAGLIMVVMLLASGANAKPKAIKQIQWLTAGVALVGVGCLAASIWSLSAGRPGLSAALGVAPVGVVIVLVAVLVRLEW